MIFEDLQKVFDVALYQFGIANDIEFYRENIDSPTDTTTPYLAGFLLLAPTEQADLGVTEFREGVYQVDINYESNIGSADLNKMADALNQAFYAGRTLFRNDICVSIQSVDLGNLSINNGWATKPLSINFNSYTARISP